MSRLLQQIRELVFVGDSQRYRRVLVEGNHVLLTRPQARRFEELSRRNGRRL